MERIHYISSRRIAVDDKESTSTPKNDLYPQSFAHSNTNFLNIFWSCDRRERQSHLGLNVQLSEILRMNSANRAEFRKSEMSNWPDCHFWDQGKGNNRSPAIRASVVRVYFSWRNAILAVCRLWWSLPAVTDPGTEWGAVKKDCKAQKLSAETRRAGIGATRNYKL